MTESTSRPAGGTEFCWCKAVPGGTGITVLGLMLSKPPSISILQNALNHLQNSHPILRSKIHFDDSTNTFHFVAPQTPHVEIQPYDHQAASQIVQSQSNGHDQISPFHALFEHEMNVNPWRDQSDGDTDVMYASAYAIEENRLAVFLRMHTAGCDRVSVTALLGELIEQFRSGGDGGGEKVGTMNVAIEDLVPEEKKRKPFWARGFDMLGYSVNGFRLANLNFVDADSPRCSRILRLRFNEEETKNLIDACKSRGIKLSGALAAAGMIASWTSKNLPDHQREKYGVVTLIDCRSALDPVLPSNHVGFYHAAIMNTHDVCKETLWELAERINTSFANAKNNNKHFTDMSDLNFLMMRAIENPGLTPSSSLRTSLISVFEDPIVDNSTEILRELGVEDYLGCGSLHGIGTSMSLFDTIRDGKLDCAFVYPSPLHSREQIQELVDHMKSILLNGSHIE
ncbi:hypothetical protein PIB30_025872 [Stylosanthes scabra]|uniref:Phthiocerol/phthiodiolone dimycocerosyl transferase C-terminal domain-containing protein n=1 Tax=Stylosanthes scabra TaxID=79078 RepID=A0ABU6WA42_9FABA|nr:hypothetical protein [Stylosanthes scabra]